jgi:hypothetical protein
MDSEKIMYKLGYWSPKYILDLSAKLIDFYCFKCGKHIHGMTAYEHFMTCCPEFIEKLNSGRKRRFGHVKQKRSDYLRTFGPSEESQQALLFPESKNNPKAVKEILQSDDFEKALEPAPKEFRRRRHSGKDSKTQEGY